MKHEKPPSKRPRIRSKYLRPEDVKLPGVVADENPLGDIPSDEDEAVCAENCAGEPTEDKECVVCSDPKGAVGCEAKVEPEDVVICDARLEPEDVEGWEESVRPEDVVDREVSVDPWD